MPVVSQRNAARAPSFAVNTSPSPTNDLSLLYIRTTVRNRYRRNGSLPLETPRGPAHAFALMSDKPPLPPDDPPEGSSLVAQMRPVLVKYFRRRTGNAVEAEDLTQDVLVRALTHAHWQSWAQAQGYIFRIAVNRWRDRYRRLQTQGQTVAWDEAAAEHTGTENSPERVLVA